MKDKIKTYVRAGCSCIYITSFEEDRVECDVRAVAIDREFSYYTWSCTQGIIDFNTTEPSAISDTKEPMLMLEEFAKLPEKSIVVCKDLHGFLADPNPVLFRQIKDSILIGKGSNRVLVIVGAVLKLPIELEKHVTVIDFALPGRDALDTVLTGICGSAGITLNGNRDTIIDAGSGGTTTEFEQWLSIAVIESEESGKGKDIDPRVVDREKAGALKKSGILEVMNTDITFEDLGGLEELKAWVHRRERAFTKEAVAYRLPTPKGIILFGVQGCGKSLATKAIANELDVPLLKLDAGKLFNSLVGSSEAMARNVIAQVEAFGKCALQIEELDKAFAGMKSSHDGDSGTTRRVIGTFLTWMQEKTSPSFIVATANDLTKLPPELLRKGRWDELFFIDLPTEAERVEIWKVQIRRHHRAPKDYDLGALAKVTEGWSGAEIEALFNESLYAAFDTNAEPDTELLVALSKDTAPLSKMMAAEIEALRQWSTGKARRASRAQVVQVKGRRLA